MRIEKLLQDWREKGLISLQQQQDILVYQRNHSPFSSRWALISFFSLGGLVVGVGMISLIASNWHQIPDSIKVGIDLLVLLGLGIACYKLSLKKTPSQNLFFDGLLLIYMLFILASIGLISQVFHLQGELSSAFCLWGVLTVGLAFQAQTFLPPFLWYSGFFGGAVGSLGQDGDPRLMMSLPVLGLAFFFFLKRFQKTFLLRIQLRSLAAWSLLTTIIALLVSELSLERYFYHQQGPFSLFWWGIWATLAIILVWLDGKEKCRNKILLSLALLGLGLGLGLPYLEMIGLKELLLGAFLTISVLCSLAFFFALRDQKRTFSFLLMAIGLRFIIFYFQALGGLAMTGIDLILSGLLIILLSWIWARYRLQLLDWMRQES